MEVKSRIQEGKAWASRRYGHPFLAGSHFTAVMRRRLEEVQKVVRLPPAEEERAMPKATIADLGEAERAESDDGGETARVVRKEKRLNARMRAARERLLAQSEHLGEDPEDVVIKQAKDDMLELKHGVNPDKRKKKERK
jgi:hypothetical protein